VIVEGAPAKVNLYLHVVGRRSDGYHELDSLAVFPGAGDRISATPSETISLEVVGPFAHALQATPDNLVLRAATLLAEWSALTGAGPVRGARLMLDKRLPVASGIGGGSADAAATLRVLKRLWNLPMDPVSLRALAARLGADVPVCLESTPTRMGGIGERLQPAPALPRFGLALINPGVPIATVDIFRARAPVFSQPAELPLAWASAQAMAHDLSRLSNDLESVARRQCPIIDDVLSALTAHKSCLLARMSGSGATCFGIFVDEPAAHAVVSEIEQTGWWCWSGLSSWGTLGGDRHDPD